MEAISKLLDEAKDKTGIPSDYALAQAIGIKRATISGYRHGKSAPDVYAMSRLADLTGRTLTEVIAMIEVETETDEAKKEYWKGFYKRLGGIAATVFVTFIVTSMYREAAPLFDLPGLAMCIM